MNWLPTALEDDVHAFFSGHEMREKKRCYNLPPKPLFEDKYLDKLAGTEVLE
jgi:hypothetical protein